MIRNQAYLYKIIKAIQTKVIDKTLLCEKPGSMSYARWFTTDCRICMLFVSQDQPCEELHLLNTFGICHYGPIWFSVKSNSWCADGPKHFLEIIKLMHWLPTAIKAVVWPVIQRNTSWAHHETVLLALLADSDTCNWELRWIYKVSAFRPFLSVFFVCAFLRKSMRFFIHIFISQYPH